ncbi:GatB/YqeY domain-containing protein [Bacillus phage vB_BanS_Skywalker]|uniref:GatB/YqeY domain-containing protein n=1 Tax=Bacillus phage vB_BanS_Skywalker TaxID=2894789 RepID=A0AAE8YV45_9CAUD|nr:GatB/YqeY domain-containing protein [Bacillus phage vB_BanS_Skywalker]UGO51263.1 GatB/YqeY domain-containing protein [Bacillus phage vB_BanS_Skywalker]
MIKTIKADLVTAMKNKEELKKSVIRMLIALLEKEKVEFKLETIDQLSEEQIITVIGRMSKALDKEIEEYKKVGRTTEVQEEEKVILGKYLPKQLTDEEITKYVVEIAESTKATGGKIGQAMQEISRQLRGKADMKKVSEMMRKRF